MLAFDSVQLVGQVVICGVTLAPNWHLVNCFVHLARNYLSIVPSQWRDILVWVLSVQPFLVFVL